MKGAIVLFVLAALCLVWLILSIIEMEGFFLPLIFAIGFGLWGVHRLDVHNNTSFNHLTVREACQIDNARSVPGPASVTSAHDKRVGPIYPCYYLMDHGVVPGVDGTSVKPVPMKLSSSVSENMFTDQDFTASGKINGLLIFGTGGITGSYDAQKKTKRTSVVGFTAQTTRGYANFMVETSAVRYNYCVSTCSPSVEIWTSQEALFIKKDQRDTQSIWALSSLASEGTIASPSQTIQALATFVSITLPEGTAIPAGAS